MKELLLIGFIAFIFWLWRDSMLSRELAYKMGKQACQQIGAQLLDDTVSLVKFKLCRNKNGVMALCRIYSFEFTQSGEKRHMGKVSMLGQVINEVVLDTHQVI